MSPFCMTFMLACKHRWHDFWCQTVGVKTLLRFFRSATFDHSRVHEVFSVFAFSKKKIKTVLGWYLKVKLKKFKIGPSFWSVFLKTFSKNNTRFASFFSSDVAWRYWIHPHKAPLPRIGIRNMFLPSRPSTSTICVSPWSLRDHTRPRNGCNLVGPAGTYCLGILPPRWSLPRLNNFDDLVRTGFCDFQGKVIKG